MTSLFAVRGELVAGVPSPYNCGKCFEPMAEDVWLCDKCWKDRESKQNRYGLTRLEGVQYACNCFASGTNTMGDKVVQGFRWQHENYCSLFKQKVWKEKVCDCPKGSKVNDDGSITVRQYDHDLACPIRKKAAKESVETNPFFGGYT